MTPRGRDNQETPAGRDSVETPPVGQGRNARERDDQTAYGAPRADPSVDYEDGTLSVPGDFAAAMRIANENDPDITAGMGSGTGDEDGISQGADIDLQAARGDVASTGTPERAGLGGVSSGSDLDFEPAAGSGMANSADMGEQS